MKPDLLKRFARHVDINERRRKEEADALRFATEAVAADESGDTKKARSAKANALASLKRERDLEQQLRDLEY